MRIGEWRLWVVGMLILAALSLGAAGCKSSPDEGGGKGKAEPTGSHAALLKLFPGAGDVSDWKASGDVKFYGPAADATQSIEPIEVDNPPCAAALKGYGYVKSATRQYARGKGAETLTVRVFQMTKSQEAFGLFSVSSKGSPVPDIGLAARENASTLSLVKGDDFITIEYSGPNDSKPVLSEFGRWIAGQIPSAGYGPSLMANFPAGFVDEERYFLHTFATLDTLAFVPKSNPMEMARALSLRPETDMAIVGYPTDKPGVVNYLFLIRYPSEADAQAAYKVYVEGYLASTAIAAEKNIAVPPPVHSYLAGTFNAEENSVSDQLAKLLATLGG